ncbi:vanadium-dependent haloperoxidase [Streptomyces sp. NPDC048718]|uniref:vanadium-dependent haloperoxidase n=1 Tax=Streptomyces sp. NPDC048718 TaxID=3365587 RepID=UPI00372046BA
MDENRSIRRRSLLLAGAGLAAGSMAVAVPPAQAAPSSRAASAAPAATIDHVLYWNQVLRDTFRGLVKGAASPGRLTRTAAMMNGAIYDSANSASRATVAGGIGQPYLIRVPVPAGTAPDVSTAIDHAAYGVLSALYPKASYPQFDFDAALGTAQAAVPGSVTQAQREQAAAIGSRVAQVMLVTRRNDGADATIGYIPGNRPGDWRPTGADAAVDPHWGRVRPFTMASGNQFRPSRPMGAQTVGELIGNTTYLAHVEELRDVGGVGAPGRSADQTRAAHFWANDVDGTYKPPGQLLAITERVAGLLPDRSELTNAKLFAWMSLALADAAIAAWDAKYDTDIDLWRPETAIHLHATHPDAGWRPESRDRAGNSFSPPFPAFVSGHATFAGAWSQVLRNYVGRDDFAFEAGTDDPYAQGATRSFTSFSAAAREDAVSRVWLGVHYRFDGEYGLATGAQVADWATRSRLGPPTDVHASDSFGRTVAGGWGTADSGGDWWVGDPAGGYSADGSRGQVVLPAPGVSRSAYLHQVLTTDTDLTLTFSVDKAATGGGVYVSAVGRKVDGSGTYRALVLLRADGGVSLQLRRADATGAETDIGTASQIPGLSVTPGMPLRVRFQVTGAAPTTLRAKVWQATAGEPSAWQVSATDSTADLQGAGSTGLLVYLSGSATSVPVTLSVDDFKAVRTI